MKSVLLSSFTVKNAADWKANYHSESSVAMRARAGMHPLAIYQAIDNENHLTLLTEVDDMATFRAMMSSPEFAAETDRAGMTSKMEVQVMTPMA